MKCDKCDKRISRKSTFCKFCGSEVNQKTINKDVSKIKKKNSIIIVSLLLGVSIFINIFLLSSLYVYDKTINEKLSNLNNKIKELEDLNSSNGFDSTILEKKTEINIDEIDDMGYFDSIIDIERELQRNINNPEYFKIEITGTILRTNDKLYLCILNGVEDRYLVNTYKTAGDEKKLFEVLNSLDKIIIYMQNDSTNRVLSGDKVIITGILDTQNMYIFDCTYELVS